MFISVCVCVLHQPLRAHCNGGVLVDMILSIVNGVGFYRSHKTLLQQSDTKQVQEKFVLLDRALFRRALIHLCIEGIIVKCQYSMEW